MRFILLTTLLACSQPERIDLNVSHYEEAFVDDFNGGVYSIVWITLKNNSEIMLWDCSVYCGYMSGKDTLKAKNVYFGGMGEGVEWTEKFVGAFRSTNEMKFEIFDITYRKKR